MMASQFSNLLRKELFIRSSNIILRTFSLGVKFLFIYFSSIFLKPDDFINTGLLLSIIPISVVILGSEIHAISNLNIIQNSSSNSSKLISEFYASCVTSILVLSPLIILYIYALNIFEIKYIFLICLIALFEYISTEIGRSLIFKNYQLKSSILLMIRSCGMPLLIFILILNGRSINYLDILIMWLVSALFSAILGLWFIKFFLDLNLIIKNISLIRYLKLIKISKVILVMAVTYQMIFFLDRLFVMGLFSEEIVTEYYFVAMISLVMLAIIDAGISSFFLPKSYAYCANGLHAELKIEMYKNLRYAVIIVSFLSIIVWFLTMYKFQYLSSIGYGNLLLIIAGFCFFALSAVPHIVIFSFRRHTYLVLVQCFILLTLYLAYIILLTYNAHVSVFFLIIFIVFLGNFIFKYVYALYLINQKETDENIDSL